MKKITCRIPHQYLTRKMDNTILGMLLEFEKKIMKNIQLVKVDEYDLSPSNYNIEKNQIEIRGLYDGIFYEKEYKYDPIFKINLKSNYRYIISQNHTHIESISDFDEKTILAYLLSEMDFLHPLLEYFQEHSHLGLYHSTSNISNHLDVFERFDTGLDYLIIDCEDFDSLDKKFKKKLHIIARYSKIPGLLCMKPWGFSGIKRKDFKDFLTSVDFFNSALIKHFEFKLDEFDKKGHQLIVEAINQYPDGFTYIRKNKQNRMMNALSFREKLKNKEIEADFDSASIFSDRMVKMYREVKNEYNDLSKTLATTVDKLVLFSIDGTVHGISKGFYEYLNLKRDKILNEDIYKIFYSDTVTEFKNIIKQVEFGLVKSLFVNIKIGRINKKEKIEFNVIELIDKRCILGKIIK